MAELSTPQQRCEKCGRESIYLALAESSSICEDCRPETGAGSRLVERLAMNLRRLRLGAGMKRDELERRAGMASGGRVASYEGDDAEEPNLSTALRLAHSLGVSIDQLTDGIYWTPGQVLRGKEEAPAERLAGFFEVLPGNVPIFEPRAPREAVSGPEGVARIFGANLRDARERRHLTQRALASATGLSRSGVILIEAGTHETTIEALFEFSRALESPPELLLDGIGWKPVAAGRRPPASSGEASRPAGSLDDGIRRLWAEGVKTREIAARLGTSAGNVSATVHRLRERGERVSYRRPPTRAMHSRARARREACGGIVRDLPSAEPIVVETAERRPPASNKAIVTHLGANIARYRKRAGLTFRALAEATEINYSPLCRLEKARSGIPQPAFVLKLAGSLNVRCGLITEGVKWDVASQSFRIEETPKPPPPLAQLGLNAMRARYRSRRSQQSVGDRASLRREDVADLERGSRNFRLSTVIRLASALEISFDELFAETSTWHVRPLAPPEFLPDQRPRRAERDRLLVRLWHEGRPETEIADALGLSRNAVAPYVRELRNAGEDLPYRRPPRSAIEAAARRRRDHTGKTTRAKAARWPASP